MSTATLFDDGGHQAVRLPKGVRFEGAAEVEVKQEGSSLVLTPKQESWLSLADLPKMGKGFLAERPDLIEERG